MERLIYKTVLSRCVHPQQAQADACRRKEERIDDHRDFVSWIFPYEVVGEGEQDDEHEEQEVQGDERTVVAFDDMEGPMVADPVVSHDEETQDEADELRQQPVDLVVQPGGDLVWGELDDTDVDR